MHSLDMHAGQAAALADALGLHDLTIVGQDWGGPVTAALAARRPGPVRAAVFANTSLSAPKHPPRLTLFHRLSNTPVVNDLFFRYINLYRPEVMQAAVGFVSYVFLVGFLESNQRRDLILSAVFAGLSPLVHPNGLLFIGAGAVVLLLSGRFRPLAVFVPLSVVIG